MRRVSASALRPSSSGCRSLLKLLGAQVKVREAPLLFTLLNRRAAGLVTAISIGVGFAVFLGVLRFHYHISLKPFIFTIIPILLAVSAAAHFNPNLKHIISLAWDTGGVTTGPVTVPLIMALGIGISRSVGGEERGLTGFGIVTLASALPILAVLLYGFVLSPGVPLPAAKTDFFTPDNKQEIFSLFAGETEMNRYAKLHLDPESAEIFIGNGEKAEPGEKLLPAGGEAEKSDGIAALLSGNVKKSLLAIMPLALFLLVVLLVLNKGRISGYDEIILGIFLSVFGMTVFSMGIDTGLSKLGEETGRNLPATYRAVPVPENSIVIRSFFDEGLLRPVMKEDGSRHDYFLFLEGETIHYLPYKPERLDRSAGIYVHVPERGPIFGGTIGGFAAILVFAFFMGIGATLAEPALNTLGIAVEEVSVGTFKKSSLIRSVAVGVGIGMTAGFLKILFDIPIVFMLIPSYTLLLVLTAFSPEDFVAIAWDSAGITTGPIAVPLVISMGLGIGGEIGVVEGFGVIALASVYPILFVLGNGLILTMRRRSVVKGLP